MHSVHTLAHSQSNVFKLRFAIEEHCDLCTDFYFVSFWRSSAYDFLKNISIDGLDAGKRPKTYINAVVVVVVVVVVAVVVRRKYSKNFGAVAPSKKLLFFFYFFSAHGTNRNYLQIGSMQ